MSFEMILDTGSADIWFPSVPCQSCGNHSLFQPQNSTTFSAVNETWSLQYMDGSYAQGVSEKKGKGLWYEDLKDSFIYRWLGKM